MIVLGICQDNHKKNISSNKKTIFEREINGISSQKQRHLKKVLTSQG